MASSENGGFTVLSNNLINDGSLSVSEKAVLFSLLSFLNKEQQRAWPSTRRLAECTGLSQLWVLRTLDKLEEKGFIRAEKKNGCVTRYEVFTDKQSLAPNSVKRLTDLSAPLNSVNHDCLTDLSAPLNSVKPINTNTNTNLQELSTNTKNAPAKKDDFAADFEEFWRAYPKPKNPDKTPTRKKYEALRKKGVSGEDLLKAAQGYARSTQGTDPRYIKHGATFLGPQEPWRDYLTEPEATAAKTDGPPDAEELFPNLAAWWRRNQEANNDGANRLDDIPGIP